MLKIAPSGLGPPAHPVHITAARALRKFGLSYRISVESSNIYTYIHIVFKYVSFLFGMRLPLRFSDRKGRGSGVIVVIERERVSLESPWTIRGAFVVW